MSKTKINFKRLQPYLNRMKEPKINTGNLDTTLYKVDKEFQNVSLDTKDVDVLLVNKFPQKKFDDMYSTLKEGGMCVFFDCGNDPVRNSIQQWRLDKKHCPEIHCIIDDDIWFWWKPVKKDESTLNKFDQPQDSGGIQRYDKPMRPMTFTPDLPQKTYDKIVPPTPGDGHLTAAMLEKYGVGDIFFETGTYFGNGIETAIKSGKFKEIYSVELDKDLAERAQGLFKDAEVINGDSPDAIADIGRLHVTPVATFWLDAHASGILPGGVNGGTPVIAELQAIANFWSPESTIMIDDCRLFGSPEWSGVTLQEALNVLKEINPDYTIEYVDGEVEKDVLVAYVKKD